MSTPVVVPFGTPGQRIWVLSVFASLDYSSDSQDGLLSWPIGFIRSSLKGDLCSAEQFHVRTSGYATVRVILDYVEEDSWDCARLVTNLECFL